MDSVFKKIQCTGGSMGPFIPSGSEITVCRVPFEEIQEGDVIGYIDEFGKGVVHRVSRKEKLNEKYVFYTRGDVQEKEQPVAEHAVTFKVQSVEHRLFSYDMHGVTAKILKEIALRKTWKTREAHRVCLSVWKVAVSGRRLYLQLKSPKPVPPDDIR